VVKKRQTVNVTGRGKYHKDNNLQKAVEKIARWAEINSSLTLTSRNHANKTTTCRGVIGIDHYILCWNGGCYIWFSSRTVHIPEQTAAGQLGRQCESRARRTESPKPGAGNAGPHRYMVGSGKLTG